MENSDQHPEQDPAEGSRETIERDLARRKDDGKDGSSGENRSERSNGGAVADGDEQENRETLLKGARQGLADAEGKLPRDEI